MVTRTTITHEDGALVSVTGGNELDTREVFSVPAAEFNRSQMREKLQLGLPILTADLALIPDATTVELKTILTHLVKGMIFHTRLELAQLDEAGPDM